MTHEIDPEYRTMVDTHFRDAFAHRLQDLVAPGSQHHQRTTDDDEV